MHHTGQYAHGALAGIFQTFEAVGIAQHDRGGTVADRRAHQRGQRVADRRRRQHLVNAESLLELRERVVHRVLVILRRHRGNLPLSRTVAHHVIAADRRIHVHEHTVGALGNRARRRHDAFAHGQQGAFVLLDGGYVPTAIEHGEHPGFIGNVHLLGAHCQGDVALTGTQRQDGKVEGRRTGRAGVFHREHRNTLDAEAAHGNRSRNGGLPLQNAVGHGAVIHRADVGGNGTGIRQGQADGLANQVVDAALEQAAKGGHANACYIDIVHGLFLRSRKMCGLAALEVRCAFFAKGLQTFLEIGGAQVLAQHHLLVQQGIVARLVGRGAGDLFHAPECDRAFLGNVLSQCQGGAG
ncbi:hypothetical protein D3C85_1069280 [compost metagenome]